MMYCESGAQKSTLQLSCNPSVKVSYLNNDVIENFWCVERGV